jgi:hypothetical protein
VKEASSRVRGKCSYEGLLLQPLCIIPADDACRYPILRFSNRSPELSNAIRLCIRRWMTGVCVFSAASFFKRAVLYRHCRGALFVVPHYLLHAALSLSPVYRLLPTKCTHHSLYIEPHGSPNQSFIIAKETVEGLRLVESVVDKHWLIFNCSSASDSRIRWSLGIGTQAEPPLMALSSVQ